MPKKITYEYVNNYFKENNCELLEKEYKNAHYKMKYKCNCENISKIRFNNFKQGQRCSKCGVKRMIEKQKHSFEDIRNYFKN